MDKLIVPEWFDPWFTDLPEMASPRQIYRKLGISKDSVYRAIWNCELDAIRTGKRWNIPRPALKEWMLKNMEINR
jgi:excisionase family DNA binding protein